MSYEYWLPSVGPSGGHSGPRDPVTCPCRSPGTYELHLLGFRYLILSVSAFNYLTGNCEKQASGIKEPLVSFTRTIPIFPSVFHFIAVKWAEMSFS